MYGYRNAVYNSRDREVDIYTWDEEGNRIVTSIPCFPYFYYEDNNGSETSIFNTKLRKKEFTTFYNKKLFIKERGLKNIFDNYPPVQQVLIDNYWQHNDTEDFVKFPLRILFIDIEAVGKNGFSSPEDPKDEINVITVYDSLKKLYYVWGTQQYNNKFDDVIYNHCTSEDELLDRFVSFIQKDTPDVLSGWSSNNYDVPYIVNRIERVLGKDRADELSPYKNRYTRFVNNKFGKPQVVHCIDGISAVDYMDIYKKFCPVNRESYKLDYIANVELDESKTDYGDQSLYEFMVNDWNTFVDYNIQDVRLLVKLEERLQYIELLRMLAYIGCTTFETALKTVSLVTGAAAIEARKRGQRLCTYVADEDEVSDYGGGYVAEPVVGHHKGIVSFDANSLYPNTMITLNTSLETKVGKIIEIGKNKISIRNVDGVVVDFDLNSFSNFIQREKIAISKSKVLFTQKKKGILADMMDIYYKKRLDSKKKMKIAKTELAKTEKLIKESEENSVEYSKLLNEKLRLEIRIKFLDTKQMAQKLLLNSSYGALANKYCPIGDIDIAESITLTGQALIKESRNIFIKFVKEKYGDKFSDREIENKIIANDTDSEYLSFDGLVDNFSENGVITSEAYELAEEFQTYLNSHINDWAKRNLNTIDSRFEFKRENMCDYGIFLEKKRYVLHVLDKEGMECDDWKYTGVELVSTTMPKDIKPYVKKIVHNLILTRNEKSTNDILREAYSKFIEMDENQISIVKGVKNLEKYSSMCNGFSVCKGMPYHVKASYYYNLLLDELGLDKKYEKITSGDKVRMFYVKTPNIYGISVIAYKTKYPKEFKEFLEPDIELMFEKDMYQCVERFYKVMNWNPRKPNEQLMITLDDILC